MVCKVFDKITLQVVAEMQQVSRSLGRQMTQQTWSISGSTSKTHFNLDSMSCSTGVSFHYNTQQQRCIWALIWSQPTTGNISRTVL